MEEKKFRKYTIGRSDEHKHLFVVTQQAFEGGKKTGDITEGFPIVALPVIAIKIRDAITKRYPATDDGDVPSVGKIWLNSMSEALIFVIMVERWLADHFSKPTEPGVTRAGMEWNVYG